MREACPICGAQHPQAIARRARTPVLLNKLYPTREAARAAPCGTLDVVHCPGCGFAWNRAFEAALVSYDGDYNNDQTHSPEFVAHVAARAADVIASLRAPEPIDYLEIGCGQGGFIREVARVAGGRLRSVEGFDPAWRGDPSGAGGALIHKAYFTGKDQLRAPFPPTIVVSRHTIEHVPDPLLFLRSIRSALGPAGTRLYIETPCISWILSNNAMQDLFYEHCSIFSEQSLRFALEASGFGDVSISHVFGGQYLWATAVAQRDVELSRTTSGFVQWPGHVSPSFPDQWSAAVRSARGPVGIWGAGAKGVTFTLLTDPGSRLLDFAIDINPAKQGLHLPGSGLGVLSPSAAAERRPGTIFVMNPNYLSEVEKTARQVGMQASLIAVS